jgi:hypothetical protein
MVDSVMVAGLQDLVIVGINSYCSPHETSFNSVS